jgi:molecular chaperone GrpE
MNKKNNTNSTDDIRDAPDNGIEIRKQDTDTGDEQSVERTLSGVDTDRELSLDNLTEDGFQELLQSQRQLEEYRKRLEETSARAAEYEDLLKRKQAEFENFRKRAQKEAEEFKKYANREIVLDVLNVIDDFERAIESTKSSKDFDTLLEGILLVEKHLRTNLENKYGVKSIEALGQKFDPTIHEAFMMEESEKHDEDTVIEDLQKGYTMHERVIRPAKVKVAKAISSNNKSNDSIEEE